MTNNTPERRQASISTTPFASWAADDVLVVLLAPWINRRTNTDHMRRVMALDAGTSRDPGTFKAMLDNGRVIDLNHFEVVQNTTC